MKLIENKDLKIYNTFGINVSARYFSTFSSQEELAELIEKRLPIPFILGGGSNILLTRPIDGLVLKNEIRGIDLVHEDEEYVYVRAGAGESWHGFVLYCLDRGWAGVENLSLIPGSVGAAPMQNIGAYGVEIKDVFHELETYDLHEQKVYSLSGNDCEFGYRESIFKKPQYKDRYVILNVTFRFRKQPAFHTSYGAIREELDRMRVKELSIKAISQAVINIRSSKLPDPKQIGNAGSFFKNRPYRMRNLLLYRLCFQRLSVIRSPEEKRTKLAAAWLIEQCGWKGVRRGDAGCHSRQALVLVNYGNATGQEIYDLSEDILVSVDKKFGVVLEREVNIL